MSIDELIHKIDNQRSRVAVIGLGYVGLPVATLFADAGFNVTGVEIQAKKVEMINAGISPIDSNEPGLAVLLRSVVSTGYLKVTTDYHSLYDVDVILIDVETPVDEQNYPHYTALKTSLKSLGPLIKPGALVIVESTVAPGTMAQVVCPLLEETSGMKANKDFFLGYCPERVMPGKLLHNLRTLPRICGGETLDVSKAMIHLYRFIVDADLDSVDWVTAELVKTVENTYRDVQIAFANEVALICEAVGGDVWKIRELVNKTPYRQMHLPGAGVGGHCIPKDPWLLVHGVKDKDVPVRLIPVAREINDGMPAHVASLVENALAEAGLPLVGVRILILGYAYLEDSDDIRNSPTETLIQMLKKRGSNVVIHDPFVPSFQGDLYKKAVDCDAAILMVAHSEYKLIDLQRLMRCMKTPVWIEGRRVDLPYKDSSIIYKSVGKDFRIR